MSDARLPIKVVRIPGGAVLQFANGERLYAYGRDAEIARAIQESKRQLVQTETPVLSDGRRKGPQHEKGTVRKVAEETGVG